MTLFVSDVHFGRRSRQMDRCAEDDLLDCLRAHEASIDRLVLLGDIFDCYIEYPHLVPKGLTRLKALLSEWTRQDVSVLYLVGNHDPWHLDHFERAVGVELHFDPVIRSIDRRTVYLAHGDGFSPSNSIYGQLKPLLRNPMAVRLYRTMLPAGLGLRLGRWYSRQFSREKPDPAVIKDLRAHARSILQSTRADTVIMGHTHHPEDTRWPNGRYINTGSWYFDRTFATLEGNDIFLKRWNGQKALLVEHRHPSNCSSRISES